MKLLPSLCSALWLSGCAYTYNINTKEGTPTSEMATITFSNYIKMAEIDGQKFRSKYSMWAAGSHTVHLPPGLHTFTFRYSDINGSGSGLYTRDTQTLSKMLETGERYELAYEIKNRFETKGRSISFAIKYKTN